MDDGPRHCRDCRNFSPRTTLSGICLARPDGAGTVTGYVLDDIPMRCEAFAEQVTTSHEGYYRPEEGAEVSKLDLRHSLA